MTHGASCHRPQPQPPPGPAARVAGGLLLPVFTVLSAVWFAAAAILVMAIWWDNPGFGFRSWDLPLWNSMPRIPLWALVAGVVAVYALLALPIGAARRTALHYANGGRLHGWADAWSGLLWVAVVALLLLAAWQWLRIVPGGPVFQT